MSLNEARSKQFKKLLKLGAEAMPESDDEWGSERQVEAENQFYTYAESLGLLETDPDTGQDMYLFKATTDEGIAYVLNNFDGLCYGRLTR